MSIHAHTSRPSAPLFVMLCLIACAGAPRARGADGAAPTADSRWVDFAAATAMAHATPPVNPADRRPSKPADQPGPDAPDQPIRLRTYEMPAVNVVGEPAPLREDELIGPYAQPRWTATRRFPTTRIYVIPEGKVELEYWYRPTFDRDGQVPTRMLAELEVGLPFRFQLDVYLRTDQENWDSGFEFGQQIEVRWALADWGEIWGNPTLYLEWIGLDGRPDKIEPKLLLGGELTERWHWGVNLVAELETGGDREYEYQFTGGLSYTVLDSTLSIGVENTLSLTDVQGSRGNFSTSYLIGPSLQWRPVPPMTINLAPLIGIGGGSPYAQLYLNIGWEF